MSDSDSNDLSTRSKRRWLRRLLLLLMGTAVVAGIAAAIIIPRLNRFQVDGDIQMSGIHDEITVVRDEKGLPYVYARSLQDLIFGQGFVTAQDRLFQIHLMRLKASGRLTELAGDVAKKLDIQIRTIGVRRIAARHAEILHDGNREVFQAFADGVNAFIEQCVDDIPLEFSLAGVSVEPWSVEDSLSLMYLMSWDTSANLKHEVIAQSLIDKLGHERAAQLFPININADAIEPMEPEVTPVGHLPARHFQEGALLADQQLTSLATSGDLQVGSNNWATGPAVSAGDHAMLAGDPHLDPRMLPGIMYAVGYITPEIRAVGAGVPGIPGFIVGRNEHVATAVTNSYGDVQDLYVETIDPEQEDHYLEGGESLPFHVETETLRIKDDTAADGFRSEEIQIRSTVRGPVVSDVLPGISKDQVLTLRWAAAESMEPNVGLTDLLTAQSTDDINRAIRSVTYIVLNFIFADIQGNIGWRASGRIPLRTPDSGTLPFPVAPDAPWTDNWNGWIPFEEMPHKRNPERGWLGTANHYTVAPDYPHYFSNYAAPSYRYRRMKERINGQEDGVTVDEHWAIQRDTKNLMAEAVVPTLISALQADEVTQPLGDVLEQWNLHDAIDKAGPTVFQSVYGEFAKAVYTDELGEDLANSMLNHWYFWQERFQWMVLNNSVSWFDDQSTPDVTETRDDMIRRGGRAALPRLAPQLGADPTQWNWGQVHTMQFDNPIRRSGVGREWLGSGPHPVDGSGETLYRGWYSFGNPYEVTFAAALRMVVDFGDSEKVRAVLAGGTTARTFHPHQKDQIDAYVSGEPMHWWFSDKAIEAHAVSRLRLVPE